MKSRTARRVLFAVTALLLLVFISLIALESVSRLIFKAQQRRWNVMQSEKNFFYRQSPDDVLGYEIKEDFFFRGPYRWIRTDAAGLRGSSRPQKSHPKRHIAILGDSVAFGMGISQEQTFVELTQSALDRSKMPVQLLNLAVPGYNLDQIYRNFSNRADRHDIQEAYYFLNWNDFCRNGTVYQGASDGLYEMYRPPRFKLPYFARKLVYRAVKSRPEAWYRWLYYGNRRHFYSQLDGLADFCANRGIKLTVFILPSRLCLNAKGVYALQSLHEELKIFLNEKGIASHDLAPALLDPAGRLMDLSDHPTIEGNQILSRVLLETIDNP